MIPEFHIETIQKKEASDLFLPKSVITIQFYFETRWILKILDPDYSATYKIRLYLQTIYFIYLTYLQRNRTIEIQIESYIYFR